MQNRVEGRASKTPKGKATKAVILEAAESVFMEKGFLAASIDDVIKRSGVSSGALYHHFPGKKSLLEGIAEKSLAALCAKFDVWLADDSLDPGEKLDAFLAAADDRVRLRLALEKTGMGLAREDRDQHELVLQMGLEPLTARLATLIERGNATGEFDVPHPRAAAVILLLLLSEFAHRAPRVEKLVPRRAFAATLRESFNRLLGRRRITCPIAPKRGARRTARK